MNKRWYDLHPTMSMAVSLLQNTTLNYRLKTVSFIENRIREIDPGITNRITQGNGGFWAIRFIQKRRTMDERSWAVVETMRYLSETDKEHMAKEIIRYIYCLENDENMDFLHEQRKPVANFGFAG